MHFSRAGRDLTHFIKPEISPRAGKGDTKKSTGAEDDDDFSDDESDEEDEAAACRAGAESTAPRPTHPPTHPQSLPLPSVPSAFTLFHAPPLCSTHSTSWRP